MAGRDKGRSFIFNFEGPTCILEVVESTGAMRLLGSQGLAVWPWIYLLTMIGPYLEKWTRLTVMKYLGSQQMLGSYNPSGMLSLRWYLNANQRLLSSPA